MKRSNFNLAADSLAEQMAGKSWRRPLHWASRWAVILLITLLLAGSGALTYSLYQPFSVLLPTRVYQASRTASIDYQVAQAAPDGLSETLLGENQVYISGLADAVQATFHYAWQAPLSADLTWSDEVTASLVIREQNGDQRVLFEQATPVVPVAVASESTARFELLRSVRVDLGPFYQQAKAFSDQSQIAIVSELQIRQTIKTQGNVLGGLVAYIDTPTLIVPLTQDTFEVTEQLPASYRVATWRWVPYAVTALPIPYLVYPAVTALMAALLILWLTLTRTRKTSVFEKKLRQMQRLARGRLMLISDKAWEPEWCVTATDYPTMVKTARRLKHPIFCHVDRTGETPAAYFYVYYGENNYCLTFRPEGAVPTQAVLPRPEFSGQLPGELADDGSETID